MEEDVEEDVEEAEAEAEEVEGYPEAEEEGVKGRREEAVAQVRIRFRRRRRRRRWWWWWWWMKWRDGCGYEAGGGRGRGIATPAKDGPFAPRDREMVEMVEILI